MNKRQHLKDLDKYLHPVNTIELKISMAVPGSLVFCFVIARIAKDYKSTQEIEDIVTEHLEALCRIHFSKRRQKV